MLWKRCLNARLPLPQPLSTCCFPRFTRFQRPGSWGCVRRALAQGGILMFCVCVRVCDGGGCGIYTFWVFV
ncbi:hypothetical protein GQ607_012168 [Colletotrichum asianum]|uniref:Uncharacterized protein n=1 Tax=Colletotrichum asianum TaxID=702518 RepID=A0A8H3ZM43_9PEZI|nr:hypothetical protein GQ607_012168 [Colletotrichum asianum]